MYNKKIFLCSVLAVFLLCLFLGSCGTDFFIGKDADKNISLSLSRSTLSTLISRAAEESDNNGTITIKMALYNSDGDKLIDSKSETHTFEEWKSFESKTVSFQNVPVASEVYAVAEVSTGTRVLFKGESQKTQVQVTGTTSISITLELVEPLDNGQTQKDDPEPEEPREEEPKEQEPVTPVEEPKEEEPTNPIEEPEPKDDPEPEEPVTPIEEPKEEEPEDPVEEPKQEEPTNPIEEPEPEEFVAGPFVLWSNVRSKFSEAGGYTAAEGYGGTTGDTSTIKTGAQVFSSLEPDLTITNPLDNSINWEDFCFSGDYLFALNIDTLYIYKPEGNGYTLEKTIELSDTLSSKIGTGQYHSISDIEIHNGYLYFSWYYYLEQPDEWITVYGIARVKMPDDLSNISSWDLETSEWALTDENISGIGVFEVTDNMIFYATGSSLHRRSYTVTSGGVSEAQPTGSDGTITLIEPEAKVNWYSIHDSLDLSLSIKDLQVIGTTLYAAVYSHDYNSRISNGGILKFPVNLDGMQPFEPETWNESIPVPKILGWYKDNSGMSAPPPLDKAGEYFYGACKFIAKKPDELIIADDGAYFDDENHKLHFKERVVTVNLLTESLSATDVNVTFSCTFSDCGFY